MTIDKEKFSDIICSDKLWNSNTQKTGNISIESRGCLFTRIVTERVKYGNIDWYVMPLAAEFLFIVNPLLRSLHLPH